MKSRALRLLLALAAGILLLPLDASPQTSAKLGITIPQSLRLQAEPTD